MPREISSDFRQQVHSPEMEYVPLVILDLTHELIDPEVIRVVNNIENIVYDSNTYLATSFKFTPPKNESGVISSAKLSISNIDRRIIELVRSISGLINVTARIVVVGESAITEEAGPWYFYFSSVTYNAKEVTGTLTSGFKNKQYLSPIRVLPDKFPALAGAL